MPRRTSGNGDAAARYLYATLNHGTPLYTWCEERPAARHEQCSGDRQHLWTPVAVVRAIRDSMVLEDGDGLQLGLGADRSWLAGGKPLGISAAPTRFGRVAYSMQYDAVRKQVVGQLKLAADATPAWAVVHVRLPGTMRHVAAGSSAQSGATLLPGGNALAVELPRGGRSFHGHGAIILRHGRCRVRQAHWQAPTGKQLSGTDRIGES